MYIRLSCLLLLVCWSAPVFAQTQPDSLNRKKLYTAIATEAVFYSAGISYLQFIWYKDKERVPFHYYNDAAGYLQINKFGHAFGAYIESYIGYHWLRTAGVKQEQALLYGGTLGLVLQTPIEIFDGLYEGWGFSWSDMAANAAGAGLVIGNELLFGGTTTQVYLVLLHLLTGNRPMVTWAILLQKAYSWITMPIPTG